ncbi:T9SS type A sorting domain-containing protein [Psychroflexus sediminis]|uniref:Por secretion system C-terminal sorting domain-containing protein n=1 Tax=Psychroflexus sediminis TaxID=470826 RepID=A0A1G7TY72_9FLAO|nr:T9SS type A sorting domain-containing protein [Psychroflexus sediminis]SDG40004.1 Por secretion system C-terminal sorting domain-containing protein [Psychroflexus sediminis]
MNKIILFLFFSIFTCITAPCNAQGTTSSTNKTAEYVFISDGEWTNPDNWKNQSIPPTSSKILIQANLVLNVSVVLSDLEIRDGASIAINSQTLLSVTGHIKNDGEIYGEGELVLNASSPQYIRGNGSYVNLRLSNPTSVHLKDKMDVYGNLYVDAGNFVTNNNLHLRCDLTTDKTAQVGRVSGHISGKVTVEHCYTARRAFRLVSPSVTTFTSIHKNWQEDADSYFDEDVPENYGTHITGLNPGDGPAYLHQDGEKGFDFSPSGDASMFVFNNQQAEFIPIDNTNVNKLKAGSPYKILVRGDRSINIYSNSASPTPTRLRAEGELVTGDYTKTDLSTAKDGFSLIGNPYHAQVDMNKVLAKSKNIRKDVYYVWDPKLGGVQDLEEGGGRGAYVVVELPSGRNSSNSEASQYLQPMQAAFVQTIDENALTELNFSETDKVSEQEQTQAFSTSGERYLNIQLYNEISFNAASTPSDALRIDFGENNSNSANDDIGKLPNIDENFARLLDQNLVAWERRALLEDEEILPLYIDQYRRKNYILHFETSDVFEADIYLWDQYLETEILISEANPTYAFNVDSSVSASVDENRFSLRLKPVSLSASETQLSTTKLYPNPTQGSFSISGLEGVEEVSIYNMIGQRVYSQQTANLSQLLIRDFSAEAGIYLVKLTSKNQEQSFKLLKEN